MRMLLLWVAVAGAAGPAAGSADAQFASSRSLPPPSSRLPRIVVAPSAGPSTRREVSAIVRTVDRAQDDRQLTRRQARTLKGEAGVLADNAGRYGADGVLTASEQRELDNRTMILRDQVTAARSAPPPVR